MNSVSTHKSNDLEIAMSTEIIDVTSDRPSPDPRWTFVDAQGHEHAYDHGYPTLDEIVDEEHWCDGHEGIYNHDPHLQVDKSHLVCQLCGETVEPGILPAGFRQSIPGLTDITIKVRLDNGWWAQMFLADEAQTTLFMQASPDDQLAVARQLAVDFPEQVTARWSPR